MRPLSSVRRYAGAGPGPAGGVPGAAHRRRPRGDAAIGGRSSADLHPAAALAPMARQLWASRFDEPRADVFAVQDSISERSRLGAADQAGRASGRIQIIPRRPRLAERTVPYLQTHPWRSGRGFGISSRRSKSIRPTPGHLAGLADAYRTIGLVGGMPDAFVKGRQAARSAIALDDRLAEGHAVLGFITFWYDWDWACGGEGTPSCTAARSEQR